MKLLHHKFISAYTIVELAAVIVIIGILAAIAVFSYRGWRDGVAEAEIKSDIVSVNIAMKNAKNWSEGAESGFPVFAEDTVFDGSNAAAKKIFTQSQNVTLTYYSGSKDAYCIEAVSKARPSIYLFFDSQVGGEPKKGTCAGGEGAIPISNGATIQTITATNCPTTRTRAVDARDNHTYWVQKLDDGKCWMLTNLAYAGGGTNTYNDTKTLQNGTSDTTTTYTEPKYYIPSGANPTTEPTNPSTSTTGTGQYGYLYNWCAAMGGQTPACQNASGSGFTSASVCPSGWRLPTGGSTGEFKALNTAVNSGSTTTDAGLRSTWLAQLSGYWSVSFNQGSFGLYWSSLQISAGSAYDLYFHSSYSGISSGVGKNVGRAVRCLAN